MGPVGTLGAQPDPWAREEVVTRATLRTQRQDSTTQQHYKAELGPIWEGLGVSMVLDPKFISGYGTCFSY